MVGNKVDLSTRLVESNEAEAFARDHNLPYFETSAKTNQGVKEAFFGLVRQVRIFVSFQFVRHFFNNESLTVFMPLNCSLISLI